MSILKIKHNNEWINVPSMKGDSYILTETDKRDIANLIVYNPSIETWTFELEDGSTVTKAVAIHG